MSNRNFVGVVACMVIGGCVLFAASHMMKRGPTMRPEQWYYDLGTGKLFATDGTQTPPIAAPSGSEGVLAVVLSCGDCNLAADRVVAFLEKWPEDTQFSDADVYTSVAQPSTEPKWVPRNSDAGTAVTHTMVKQLRKQCPTAFKKCQPDDVSG